MHTQGTFRFAHIDSNISSHYTSRYLNLFPSWASGLDPSKVLSVEICGSSVAPIPDPHFILTLGALFQ